MRMLSRAPARFERNEEMLEASKTSLKMERTILKTAKRAFTAQERKVKKCQNKKEALARKTRKAFGDKRRYEEVLEARKNGRAREGAVKRSAAMRRSLRPRAMKVNGRVRAVWSKKNGDVLSACV